MTAWHGQCLRHYKITISNVYDVYLCVFIRGVFIKIRSAGAKKNRGTLSTKSVTLIMHPFPTENWEMPSPHYTLIFLYNKYERLVFCVKQNGDADDG